MATLVAATTSSSFTINNLIANTDYNFTVLALDADDNASQQVLMFSKTLSNSTPVVTGSVFINEIHTMQELTLMKGRNRWIGRN
jgi:hypothetical protein